MCMQFFFYKSNGNILKEVSLGYVAWCLSWSTPVLPVGSFINPNSPRIRFGSINRFSNNVWMRLASIPEECNRAHIILIVTVIMPVRPKSFEQHGQ